MTTQLSFTGEFFIKQGSSKCESFHVTTYLSDNAPQEFSSLFTDMIKYEQGEKASNKKRTYDDIIYETVEDVLLDFPEYFIIDDDKSDKPDLKMSQLSFVSKISY